MGSRLPQGSPYMLQSVARDIIMVAYVFEAAAKVVSAALLERVVLVLARCRAVKYDFVYCTHVFGWIRDKGLGFMVEG